MLAATLHLSFSLSGQSASLKSESESIRPGQKNSSGKDFTEQAYQLSYLPTMPSKDESILDLIFTLPEQNTLWESDNKSAGPASKNGVGKGSLRPEVKSSYLLINPSDKPPVSPHGNAADQKPLRMAVKPSYLPSSSNITDDSLVTEEKVSYLPMDSPSQNTDIRLRSQDGESLKDGPKLPDGDKESGNFSHKYSFDPSTWEPQRIQPRKTNFLTKRFRKIGAPAGRDLLKKQTTLITKDDQAAGEHGSENVVVDGERSFVSQSSKLPPRNSKDRVASVGFFEDGTSTKKCIDSDKLLFCLSSAEVSCPRN